MIQHIKDIHNYFAKNRYSTISGTIVYFFLMSFTPLLFWFILVVGKIELPEVNAFHFIEHIQPMIQYFYDAAEQATWTVSVVFLITSLYSCTNLFYHIRRSGEIMYGVQKYHGGWKLRIISLLLLLAIFLSVAVLVAILTVVAKWLSVILARWLFQIVMLTIITLILWVIVLLFNIFMIPIKINWKGVIIGSLTTILLWYVCIFAFGIYIEFAQPSRLYGKIALLFVFLLWLYWMSNCFMIGAIIHKRFKEKEKLAE